MRVLNRTMKCLRGFRNKRLAIPRRGHHTGASRLLLFLGIVAVSAYVGAGDAGEESEQIAEVVSAQQIPQLEQQARNARGLRMAEAGQAAYTGEFFRVGGRKVQLPRSLEKIAVRYPPSEGFSVMNQLQSLTQAEGEFLVEHEVGERGITVLQTSKLESLDDLAESIQRLEQTPGIVRAVPVYIHEESGLELIPTDEFIVKLAAGADSSVLQAINDALGAVMARALWGTADQFILAIPDCTPEELLSTCEIYRQDPSIEWASPNFLAQLVKCDVQPNDPLFSDQWHLPRIQAPQAWGETTGNSQIIIAVIDDGMDLAHEDLRDNLPSNSLEIANNDIDDDNNGYVDDRNGWNFFDHGPNPNPAGPDDNHGTACAGVAAAKGNNGLGVAGCAFDCRLMPLKLLKGRQPVPIESTAEAIYYAAGRTKNGGSWRGADVISISFTGSEFTPINNALAFAATQGRGGKGCPIFCATGNDAAGWRKFTLRGIPAGTYTFKWEYTKNATVTNGSDTIWLDSVAFPGGSWETFETIGDIVTRLPLGWTTGGNAHWEPQRDDVGHAMTGWDGPNSYAVRAGHINHNESTYIQVTKTVGAGELSFWCWPSCEANYDGLRLYVNGIPQWDGQIITSGEPEIHTAIGYPASHPNTIAVGASTDFDYRADYSQYGAGLDFVAPSSGGIGEITTTDRTGSAGYAVGNYTSSFSGTSAAAPLAAGVAALMLSKNPDLTAQQVRDIMRSTCDQIGSVQYTNGRNDYYGHGRINAAKAVDADPAPASITVTSPNRGESWQGGTIHAITWTSTGNVGPNVKIELYKGGVLNSTIHNYAPNSGSYDWPIPSSQMIGSDYKIRVASTSDASCYDESDSAFSITAPSGTEGALVLTFEGIVTNGDSPIPDGYGGLSWSGSFCVYKPPVGSNVGYENGKVSPDYVAYNGNGLPVEVSGSPFDFMGAYLAAAYEDSLNVIIEGYRSGSQIYSQTVIVTRQRPTWIWLGYEAVDRVTFRPTPHQGLGYQFVMDNMVIKRS